MAKDVKDTYLKSLLKAESAPDQEIAVAGRQGLYVRKRGTSVTFRYRPSLLSGVRPWIVLGSYPKLSLKEAFEEHTRMEKEVAAGLDPRIERQKRQRDMVLEQNRARAGGKILVRRVVYEWALRYARHKRVRPRPALQLLRANVLVHWKDRVADELTERDAVELIDMIKARGSMKTANRVCSLAKQVFAFAVEERRLIRTNPFKDMYEPGGRERSIKRTLKHPEIKRTWKILSAEEPLLGVCVCEICRKRDGGLLIDKPLAIGLKLLLATGQRSQELVNAKFSDFDLVNRIWTIPPLVIKRLTKEEREMRPKTLKELLKNRRRQDEAPEEHLVPLTDLAISLIEQLKPFSQKRGNSPYLFQNYRWMQNPHTPINEKTLAHALSDHHVVDLEAMKVTLFGMTPFSPHDFRRTFATGLISIGADVQIVSRLINHAVDEKGNETPNPTTEGVYNKYEYLEEKRTAIEAWSAALIEIVAGRTPARIRGA